MLITSEKYSEEGKVKSAPKEQIKCRILVIEDEEELRELFSDMLTFNGYEVEAASDGHRGIELFKHAEFDIVFTDLRMPEMSGWEVAEAVKKIREDTPVVMITGSTLQLEASELKKSGVDFVVTKPFRIDQVLGLVQKVLTHGGKDTNGIF